jgi:hypothetical protein
LPGRGYPNNQSIKIRVIAVTAASENIQDHEQSWNQPIADYLQKAARELKLTRFFSLNDHSRCINRILPQTLL